MDSCRHGGSGRVLHEHDRLWPSFGRHRGVCMWKRMQQGEDWIGALKANSLAGFMRVQLLWSKTQRSSCTKGNAHDGSVQPGGVKQGLALPLKPGHTHVHLRLLTARHVARAA